MIRKNALSVAMAVPRLKHKTKSSPNSTEYVQFVVFAVQRRVAKCVEEGVECERGEGVLLEDYRAVATF